MSFSNVQPAGYYTELIVPSLLWGNQIRQERSDFAGDAAVKTAGGWQDYPDDRTLFADAERAGLAAGAVGWYIPYCRTYRRELDWCEESLGSPLPGNYSPDRSVAWNIFAPLSKYSNFGSTNLTTFNSTLVRFNLIPCNRIASAPSCCVYSTTRRS